MGGGWRQRHLAVGWPGATGGPRALFQRGGWRPKSSMKWPFFIGFSRKKEGLQHVFCAPGCATDGYLFAAWFALSLPHLRVMILFAVCL